MSAATGAPPTYRREYLGTLALLAAGGVLALVAVSRPWGRGRIRSTLLVDTTDVSGGDLVPFVPAASLVAMAAVVVVPAVRRIGRRIVGAVVAGLGAVVAVVSELVVANLDDQLESWIIRTLDPTVSTAEVSSTPGWGLATAAAGVMILVAGLVIAVRGPRWPAMGARYERRNTRREGAAAEDATELERKPSTGRQVWDALDRGDDPTD